MSKINWEALLVKNRVKAIGVPWTDEEHKAIQDGVSPDDVRNGILKAEDKEKVEKKLTPLEKMLRGELMDKAKELGISFDEKVVTRGDLIMEIKNKENA